MTERSGEARVELTATEIVEWGRRGKKGVSGCGGG